MRRVKVIVNPVSGKGFGLKSVPVIEEKFSNSDIHYDLILTEHQGHAMVLAQQAVEEGLPEVTAPSMKSLMA